MILRRGDFFGLPRGRYAGASSWSMSEPAFGPMDSIHAATALHFAAQAGDAAAVAKLAAAGADVNARDRHGNTPIKYAAAESALEAVRRLIELGADVNAGDDRGFTPLHCAAGHGLQAGAVAVAEALLAQGADVNARSRILGFVPLHEAMGAGMIRLLMERGADPGIRNDMGMTPLEQMLDDGRSDDAGHLRRCL